MAIYQGTKLLAASVNGKSAYEAAVDGGYTGSEEEFNAFLATADNELDNKVQIITWGSDD